MPLYDFDCESCGPFEVRRTIDEAAQPASCPACTRAARRIYNLPGLIRTPVAVASALGLEEKSAHEPDVVRDKRGRQLPRHGHGAAPPWVVGDSH